MSRKNSLSVDLFALLEAAYKASDNAYAPYSDFRVGAAALTGDGRVFTGCNVENASFGAAICAERIAVAKGISEGAGVFTHIAVVRRDRAGELFPCGICRQFLSEFGDIDVVTDAREGGSLQPKIYRLSELFSHSFGSADLRNIKRGK